MKPTVVAKWGCKWTRARTTLDTVREPICTVGNCSTWKLHRTGIPFLVRLNCLWQSRWKHNNYLHIAVGSDEMWACVRVTYRVPNPSPSAHKYSGWARCSAPPVSALKVATIFIAGRPRVTPAPHAKQNRTELARSLYGPVHTARVPFVPRPDTAASDPASVRWGRHWRQCILTRWHNKLCGGVQRSWPPPPPSSRRSGHFVWVDRIRFWVVVTIRSFFVN